jgi:hypothetical protein
MLVTTAALAGGCGGGNGDGDGDSDAIDVDASGDNAPPVVDAGPDQTVQLPLAEVSFTASASDPDGTIASYAWTVVTGGAPTLGGADGATVTLTDLEPGAYLLRITVTDDAGATASDDVALTVAPADGDVYYLAPDGDDGGDGSAGAPWFSLERAWDTLAPGDTLLLRGGTYAYDNMQYLDGTSGQAGAPIRIWAYPGERPLITRAESYVFDENNIDLIYLEGDYLHWRGLEIAYFEQQPGEPAWGAFRAGQANHCTFEQLDYHHNAASFSIRGDSTGNLVLDSDFHHNQDPYSKEPFDGADGLAIIDNPGTGNVNTIRGCRAYWNADDGFDTWNNDGTVVIEDSWAMLNGYLPDTLDEAGNGTGFKLGISVEPQAGEIRRRLHRNLAMANRAFGFVENEAACQMELFNNTSIGHAVFGYWFGAWGISQPAIARNNVSYDNADDQFHEASTLEANSWQLGHDVGAADFVDLDVMALLAPRGEDGALPVVDTARLAAGSPLIDAGVDVGLSFEGDAPDLGAFER